MPWSVTSGVVFPNTAPHLELSTARKRCSHSTKDKSAGEGTPMTKLQVIIAALLTGTGIAALQPSLAQEILGRGGQLQAQGQVVTPRLNLTLEQRHVIKEWIKDMKIEPAAAPPRSEVGEAVPQDAKLQAMPTEIGRKVPQVKAHQFLYTADSILIV